MVIPLFKVFMADDVDDFVSPVLHSGYIGEGEKVELFEKEIGKFIDNDNVVAVNSGTAAITMALRLAGVGHGDPVLTTPITCLATNEPILSLGAVPIWVDVLNDGTMDPFDLKSKMIENPKAIVCMDWGGLPCHLEELKKVAGDTPIIEDACQALGSFYNQKPIGNHADFVAFSFQAIKYVTTGDGGALVVNKNLKKEAQLMRWFGLDRTQSTDMRCSQNPETWGYKFHMNDIAASIGLANIRHLPWMLSKTRKHADIYNGELPKSWVKLPGYHRQSNYWLYTVFTTDPKDFIAYMHENEVACSQVHDRNDTKRMFRGSEGLIGTEYFDRKHVCIPVGWWLEDPNVEYIIDLIKEYDAR